MKNSASDIATENDVALDLVALLDHTDGALVGSEETIIESIEPNYHADDDKATFVITLDNGQKFDVRVRARS